MTQENNIDVVISIMAKFAVLFCVVSLAFASSMLLGGKGDVDKNDPELLKAVSYAMDLYNQRSNNLYREMASEIVDATKQLVAGTRYCFVTVVGTSRSCRNNEKHVSASLKDCPVDHLNMRCKFEVLVAPWKKSQEDLLSFDCTGLQEDRKLSCHDDKPKNKRDNEVKPVDVKEEAEQEKAKPKEYTKEEQQNMFDDFIQKYQKTYKPADQEYEYRFKVFQENLVKARKMQEMDMGTATYGVTQFSDLTYEEFKKMYAMPGWGEPLEPMKQADIPLGDIPESVDWRDKGAVTGVKNQGSCGSCWAFSTTGNVEGQWAIKKGKLVSLSEQELVDCDKVDLGCGGGLPANAYKQIEKLGGLETEQEYPYTAHNGQCKFDKSDVKVTINGSVAISKNEDDMAAWLAKNGPISIGINAMSMQFYMGGVAHPWKIFCNPSSLDHGVLIVGYGVKSGWFGKTPYWIIKNSWGPSWGVQGYYLIYRGGGCCGLNTACTSAVVN